MGENIQNLAYLLMELKSFEWFAASSHKVMSREEDLNKKAQWMDICTGLNQDVRERRFQLIDLLSII